MLVIASSTHPFAQWWSSRWYLTSVSGTDRRYASRRPPPGDNGMLSTSVSRPGDAGSI